ncbi:hypothetical protein D8B29_13355 [Verminephrobacter eiseniae]|nr:hypothetical protein [Verminephrobacter eiseniae]MCW8180553.1 hypothetical protein [Verminephrobacter eiseniae]
MHRQGSDSARAYLAHSGGDVEMLLTIIERTSPQLGSGTWRFEADGDRLRLESSPPHHGISHGSNRVQPLVMICESLDGNGIEK